MPDIKVEMGSPPKKQPQQTEGADKFIIASEAARKTFEAKKLAFEKAQKDYRQEDLKFRLGCLCVLSIVLAAGGGGACGCLAKVLAPPAPLPPMSPSPPLPSPPPPSPPPPVPPGRKTEAQTVVTFTAAGNMYGYGPSVVASIKAALARVSFVPASTISLSVTAGSVIIEATIPEANQASLSAHLGSASAASALLGVTVTDVPTVVVNHVVVDHSPPFPTVGAAAVSAAPYAPTALAAAAALAATVAAASFPPSPPPRAAAAIPAAVAAAPVDAAATTTATALAASTQAAVGAGRSAVAVARPSAA